MNYCPILSTSSSWSEVDPSFVIRREAWMRWDETKRANWIQSKLKFWIQALRTHHLIPTKFSVFFFWSMDHPSFVIRREAWIRSDQNQMKRANWIQSKLKFWIQALRSHHLIPTKLSLFFFWSMDPSFVVRREAWVWSDEIWELGSKLSLSSCDPWIRISEEERELGMDPIHRVHLCEFGAIW